jgi:D-sedoheptulose 7-phosphate isomerase
LEEIVPPSTQTLATFDIQRAELHKEVSAYLGLTAGGVNLRQALLDLPLEQIDNLTQALLKTRDIGGRIFFMGNGGSHDNARSLAYMCRQAGLDAKTPGREDDYPAVTLQSGYDQIFAHGLRADRVGSTDVVIGISGSGNSSNIIKGLEEAKQRGAQAFCLGGRDGGKMAQVCGTDTSIVVKNSCMEAIEDLHILVGIVSLRQIAGTATVSKAHESVVADFDKVMCEKNLPSLVDVTEGVLKTIETGSRVLALGTSIGANHVTADWERGATNRLPIRGVSAPMMFSQNAAMATLNDDGHFSLAHGLVKKDPTAADYAIVFEVLTPPQEISAAREVLTEATTPFTQFGGSSGVDLGPFSECERDLFPVLVGHAVSASLREVLCRRFEVKPMNDVTVTFKPGDKKLSREETLKLESELREAGKLSNDRVVVFNYGQIFSATDPATFGMKRVFY